jgi:hypothetical protein
MLKHFKVFNRKLSTLAVALLKWKPGLQIPVYWHTIAFSRHPRSPTPSSEICQFFKKPLIIPSICGDAALPAAAQSFQPNAAVGDVPNPWNPEYLSYELLDILKLVIFYNDDFGIVVGDPLSDGMVKVRNWLLEQE